MSGQQVPKQVGDDRQQTDRRLAGLMGAAQNGDARAYGSLLEEAAALLRRTVRARSPYLQAGDIEDRVQDILLSVHEARATYDPERPFIPWLMAIARNRMADEARRYSRRAAHEVGVDVLPETFSGDETNRPAEAAVDSMALQDAIRQLPPVQRRVIEMVKLQEMTHAEASQATGMSIAALKITVHRAVKQLRKLMGSEA